MGVFTDIYNLGAVVSKPIAGVLRYGAEQVDGLIDGVSGAESKDADMSAVHIKIYRLIKDTDWNDEEIADFVSNEDVSVSPEEVQNIRSKN